MRFAIISHSKCVDPSDVALIAQAVGMQLRDHVAPAWDRKAPEITVAPDELSARAGATGIVVPIFILDKPDMAGAYGYHTEDSKGRPMALCFAEPVIESGGGILRGGKVGVSMSSIVSHEVIETFVDPDACLWIDVDSSIGGKSFKQVSYETCDPVQGVLVPYMVGRKRVDLSNFVYPAWFDAEESGPYDHARVLKKPLSLGKGGYVIGRTEGVGSETEVFASVRPPDVRMKARQRSTRRLGIVTATPKEPHESRKKSRRRAGSRR